MIYVNDNLEPTFQGQLIYFCPRPYCHHLRERFVNICRIITEIAIFINGEIIIDFFADGRDAFIVVDILLKLV